MIGEVSIKTVDASEFEEGAIRLKADVQEEGYMGGKVFVRFKFGHDLFTGSHHVCIVFCYHNCGGWRHCKKIEGNAFAGYISLLTNVPFLFLWRIIYVFGTLEADVCRFTSPSPLRPDGEEGQGQAPTAFQGIVPRRRLQGTRHQLVSQFFFYTAAYA